MEIWMATQMAIWKRILMEMKRIDGDMDGNTDGTDGIWMATWMTIWQNTDGDMDGNTEKIWKRILMEI